MKRCLRNIDYLSYNVSEKVLDEIAYRLEPIQVAKDTYLFKAGDPCKYIEIVTSGEVSIYVNNNNRDTYLDTLYKGCIIGSYSTLTADDYTITGKCSTDCKILKLSMSVLAKLRQEHDDLDQCMVFYENYCDENGLPYCDYKLHRNRMLHMSPIEKFRLGIKRIMRIVKSHKSSALTELLQRVAEEVKKNKNIKENKRKKRRKKQSEMTPEERTEYSLIALTEKVEQLKDKLETQDEVISTLKDQLFEKMETLSLGRLASTDDSDNHSDSSPGRPENRKKLPIKPVKYSKTKKSKKNRNRRKESKVRTLDTVITDDSIPANEQKDRKVDNKEFYKTQPSSFGGK